MRKLLGQSRPLSLQHSGVLRPQLLHLISVGCHRILDRASVQLSGRITI